MVWQVWVRVRVRVRVRVTVRAKVRVRAGGGELISTHTCMQGRVVRHAV